MIEDGLESTLDVLFKNIYIFLNLFYLPQIALKKRQQPQKWIFGPFQVSYSHINYVIYMEFYIIMVENNENKNSIRSIAICIGYSGNHHIKRFGQK